jgi:hypothetical protein
VGNCIWGLPNCGNLLSVGGKMKVANNVEKTMQTFLPYADFAKSMSALDPSRLGNQVYREGMTLLRGGWPNHPASKMWRGYESALARYLWAGVQELKARGRDYSGRPWYEELEAAPKDGPNPPWLGDERIHASHRGVLTHKNPEWYSQLWDDAPRQPLADGKMNYHWPVH